MSLDALSALEAQDGRNAPQAVTLDGILDRAQDAGYPQSALRDLRSRAEMLRRVAHIARVDLDAEAQYAWDRVSETRRQRADQEKKTAERTGNPAERLSRLQHAQQLESQARKLESPSVDERFKARAVATELSIRLNARMRGIHFSVSDVEPSSLRLFEKAFQDHARGVESLGTPRGEAETVARMAFLQAMAEVDTTPDDPSGLRAAIVQYRKNTTRDFGPEAGHMRDQSLHDAPEIMDQGAPEDTEDTEGTASRSREVSRLSRALSLAAAAELDHRQYAVYLVLADNTHLFDWRVEPEGKLTFVKRHGVDRGENIAAKVVEELGGYAYSGRGAAYRAVHETLDSLGSAMQKLGRNVAIEDFPPRQRVQVMDRLTASREQIREATRERRPRSTRKRETQEID